MADEAALGESGAAIASGCAWARTSMRSCPSASRHVFHCPFPILTKRRSYPTELVYELEPHAGKAELMGLWLKVLPGCILRLSLHSLDM